MQAYEALVRKQDGQPIRYLIVDDSVFARKNLQRIVEMFGGLVAGEAADGRAAIEAYNRFRPDIVLMDVTMPDLEGIEALVLPGGESSTMLYLLESTGLRPPVEAFVRSRPVLGTCAGVILLGAEGSRLPSPPLGAIDVAVERNASA